MRGYWLMLNTWPSLHLHSNLLRWASSFLLAGTHTQTQTHARIREIRHRGFRSLPRHHALTTSWISARILFVIALWFSCGCMHACLRFNCVACEVSGFVEVVECPWFLLLPTHIKVPMNFVDSIVGRWLHTVHMAVTSFESSY